ncbi:MAG: TylF/MycF family methyltransferase [Gammaproteobacteria bacterium]|jgi:predicted O-methyltransferase YrrM|nr:TylF/MycF family methyltransferase [Gammaproteobacteria bacterium]
MTTSSARLYSIPRLFRAAGWFLFGNPTQRRRVRQELARVAASAFGDFPLSEDHKLWREDREFLDAYARLSPENPYSQDRKYLLREYARMVQSLPGVMAECGCFRGASAYFMASAAPDTPLLLFDSFAGLSEPKIEDRPSDSHKLVWTRGALAASEQVVREVLRDFTQVRYFKGWIPERFAEVAGETFKLVHIDVDLYEPTLECIRFFYPRLVRGGVIVLDDYGSTLCPGAFRAVSEYMAGKPEYVLHVPTGQGVVVKGD